MSSMGLSTHQSLQKHIRAYHPDFLASKTLAGSSNPPEKHPHEKGTQEKAKQAASSSSKEYVYEICNKALSKKSILDEYMNAHYRERKHACDVCGKRFTRANDRNRHRKIHDRKGKTTHEV